MHPNKMINFKSIHEAAEVIKNGGVVAFPTETVYGLGANALNPEAVVKIFSLKERPNFDPLIVHISSIDQIERLTSTNDKRAYHLASKFWPGPLTIVLPKKPVVPDIVTSGLPTVGIRMPDNEIALKLIEISGCPIAAPSANKFGRISPTRAEHVIKQLKGVDIILDGGPSKVGIESTVITLDRHGFIILREGFVTASQLSEVVQQSPHKPKPGTNISPGLLNSHYSPNKPIYIEGENIPVNDKSKGAYISFDGNSPKDYRLVSFLSEKSDLKEAAVNLFGVLHSLEDDPSVDFIVTQPVPESGIGKAIMDKLRKASYRYK